VDAWRGNALAPAIGGIAFLAGLVVLILLRDAAPMVGHIELAILIMAVAATIIMFVAVSELPRAGRTAARIIAALAAAFLALGIALQGIIGDDTEPLLGLIDPEWTLFWSYLAFMALMAVLALAAGITRMDGSTLGWWIASFGAAAVVVLFAIWTWNPMLLGTSVDPSILVLEVLGIFGLGATLVGIARLLLSKRDAAPRSAV
jgi:hypothetical protein